MAGSVAEAFVTVRPAMDRFGGDLKSGLGKLAKVAGAAALGITAAIGGAAVVGVKKFAQLERGMNEVFTLMPGISEEAMGQMTQDVRDFAVEMGVATEEVVPALYQSISAGVPQDNVFDFLEIATQASIGGVTDLETAVDGITSVVNAYGEDVVDAQKASDLMFTAVRLGKTDFEQLSSSLFNVIPTAAALGVKFEDVTAAIAAMTAQGTPTAVSTTQLRQLLVELGTAGSDVGDVFEEVSGQSFPEFIATGGDLAGALDVLSEAAGPAVIDVMRDLQDETSDLAKSFENEAGKSLEAFLEGGGTLVEALEIIRDETGLTGSSIADMFGSVEAANAALALTGSDAFVDNLGEMQDASGATQTAFEQMDQGLGRTWDRIKVVFSDLLIELGERIAPALQAFADWFEANLPAIVAWFEDVGDKAAELGEAIVVWWNEDAQPTLEAFVETIEESWPKIRETLSQIGQLFGTLGETISIVMGGASSDVEDTEQDWTASIGRVLDALNVFLGALNWVATKGSQVMGLFSAMFSMEMDRVILAMDAVSGGAFSNWVNRVHEMKVATQEAIADVVQFFKELPGKIVGAIGDAGNILKNIGRDIIGGLLSGFREKWEETAGWLGSLGGRIRDLKGPLEKDKVLLTDIGEEIIGGLGRGMNREWANIERMLGTMTAEIPVAARAGMAPAAAAGPSTLVVVDADGQLIGRMRVEADRQVDAGMGRVLTEVAAGAGN